jgi:hypothetical protein
MEFERRFNKEPGERLSEKIEEKLLPEKLREWFKIIRGLGHVHTELSSETGVKGEARYKIEDIFEYWENIINRSDQVCFDYFILADHASNPSLPQPLSLAEGEKFLRQKKNYIN